MIYILISILLFTLFDLPFHWFIYEINFLYVAVYFDAEVLRLLMSWLVIYCLPLFLEGTSQIQRNCTWKCFWLLLCWFLWFCFLFWFWRYAVFLILFECLSCWIYFLSLRRHACHVNCRIDRISFVWPWAHLFDFSILLICAPWCHWPRCQSHLLALGNLWLRMDQQVWFFLVLGLLICEEGLFQEVLVILDKAFTLLYLLYWNFWFLTW